MKYHKVSQYEFDYATQVTLANVIIYVLKVKKHAMDTNLFSTEIKHLERQYFHNFVEFFVFSGVF